METTALVLLELFVMFAAAKIAGLIFEKLKQPAVIGELLAGIIIGPYMLGWVGVPNEAMVARLGGDSELAKSVLHDIHHVIAELGVIILLFFVGLETRLSDILRVGLRAVIVGVLGILAPFAVGFGLSSLLGKPTLEAMFIATAMVATSVGITARVLRDMGYVRSIEARIILGAAVIDDILAMVLLAIVSGIATTGELSGGAIALLIAQAVGFTAFVVFIGTLGMRRYSIHLDAIPIRNSPFVVAMLIMLGLAALSINIGLAAIIGAFLAGMVLAEAREHYDLEHAALPVYEFLVPFFFVITGTLVDPRIFLDPGIIGLAAIITVAAIITKLVVGPMGGYGLSARSKAIIGVGMVPRGEVGLIVAGIGLNLGAIAGNVFSIVVVMSILTTLVVPPVLKLLYTGYPPPTEVPVEEGADYATQDGLLPEM